MALANALIEFLLINLSSSSKAVSLKVAACLIHAMSCTDIKNVKQWKLQL
jgi:hypothetical protein